MEVFDFMKLFADGRKKTTKGIISIGVFDGVHKGHATLLEEMNLLKDQNPGSETFVITFNTNPKPGLPRNVDTLRLRVENIKRYAIDNLVVIDFSSDFSKITGGEFVKMLTHLCEPLAVVVGFDFRCGNPKDAATAEDLHNLFLENNRDVSVLIKQAILTEGGEKISSTLVRRVIDNGEVGCIPMLTGQNYRVDLATNKAALTKGVLELCRTSIHQLLPQDGVYETRILFADGSEGEGTCMLEGESLKVQLGFSKDEAHANGTEYDGKQLDSIYFLEKRK